MTAEETYRRWLAEPSLTEAQRAELTALADNPEERNDRFYTELSFGTAGMRGKLGMGTNRLNEYSVARATEGLARVIDALPEEEKRRGVVVSYDTRHFSAEFARLAAGVLAAHGIPVKLFDAPRPVPVLSNAIRRRGAVSGVMITASHNPPAYNGYKVYWADGAQISPERAESVAAVIGETPYFGIKSEPDSPMIELVGREDDEAFNAAITSLCVRHDLLERYAPQLRIVYTPLHGTGRLPVLRALNAIGVTHASVVPEQEMPDGDFPTVKVPNPEFVETLAMGIELAKAVDADIVVGTDPDADRMGVAVRTGDDVYTALTGNEIGALLGWYILSQRAAVGKLPSDAYVIRSIVSSKFLDAIAADYACRVYSVLTGFKFVGEQMQKCVDAGNKSFMFAYEESFGFLCGPHARDKDGVSATMMISEMACYALSQGKTLYDLLLALYDRYGWFADFSYSKFFEGETGMERMNERMTSLRARAPKKLADRKVLYTDDILTGTRTYADGRTEKLRYASSNVLRYELEGDAWAAMRPSGTEPKLKIYGGVRAVSAEKARFGADELKAELLRFL